METAKDEQPKANMPPAPADDRQNWHRWLAGAEFRPFFRFGIFAAALCLIFVQPLIGLVRLAFKVEIHSHTIGIPLLCWYLIHIRRHQFPTRWTPAIGWSLTALLAGIGVLAADWLMLRNGWKPQGVDHLSMTMLGFYFLLVGGFCAFAGRELSRMLIFPIGMMILIVPLPGVVESNLERFLQLASAEATDVLFTLTGTTFFRSGIRFEMPGGLSIAVAPECSGNRSTLILFITGLLGAHLFLQTAWRKGFFILMTIPLGILRNAIRIVTITLMTLHVDPDAIKGSIHSDGGPAFFALSLIPLLGLLILLRRSEMAKKAESAPPIPGNKNQI